MAQSATSPHDSRVEEEVQIGSLLGPRTWAVRERIGEFEELLGTVEAVHGTNALMKAYRQFHISDSERMNRIRLDPLS